MNKIFKVMIPAITGAIVFTGCSSGTATDSNDNNTTSVSVTDSGDDKDGKLKIVTSIFPEYDWVNNILGEKAEDAEITLLCDSGTDMHSFEPSAEDFLKISDCDVFVYGGGVSEEWIGDALANARNKDMVTVSLMEILGENAKTEEIIEGMQEEIEEDHTDEHDDAEYDEHVWLSLKNAGLITEGIADALCEADSENSDIYRKNASDYKSRLEDLDTRYKKATDEATVKTLLFADRFPFRYLTDDYGLTYYAAFPGCSADTEASFDTVIFLAKKADELGLKHIMTIEGSDHSIADTVRSNTTGKDQDILELNSMQSVTKDDIANGLSYTDIMESNLKVLEKALN